MSVGGDSVATEGEATAFLVIATLSMILVVFLGGLLAKYLRGKFSPYALECVNAAAAGLFMAISFFHMLPELMKDLILNFGQSNHGDCGHLLTTGQIAWEAHEGDREGRHSYHSPRLSEVSVHQHADEIRTLLTKTRILSHATGEDFENRLHGHGHSHAESHGHSHGQQRSQFAGRARSGSNVVLEEACALLAELPRGSHGHCHSHGAMQNPALHGSKRKASSHLGNAASEVTDHVFIASANGERALRGSQIQVAAHSGAFASDGGHNCQGHTHGVPENASLVTAVFLLLALSLHGITEGYVCATLFKAGKKGQWKVSLVFLFSVIAHKWIEGFVVALSVLKAPPNTKNVNWRLWGFTSLCAVASPLGILLHVILKTYASEQFMISASPMINAVAVGTLVYVGVTEIVPEVFIDTGKFRKSLLKFALFTVSAAALMLFLHYAHQCPHHDAGGCCESDTTVTHPLLSYYDFLEKDVDKSEAANVRLTEANVRLTDLAAELATDKNTLLLSLGASNLGGAVPKENAPTNMGAGGGGGADADVCRPGGSAGLVDPPESLECKPCGRPSDVPVADFEWRRQRKVKMMGYKPAHSPGVCPPDCPY